MFDDELVMTHEERLIFKEIARHFSTAEAPDPDVQIDLPPRVEKRRSFFRWGPTEEL